MLQRLYNQYHLSRALLANIRRGFPGRKMTVIGVTGTDGKTTTANYIYHVLKGAGRKTALISTISAVIDGEVFSTGFHVTTPGPGDIQKYLTKAKSKGVEFVVLEVTSHALDQNRVFGIPFAVGVLTNISHEHLDYHKTMDAYAKTKLKLLKKAKIAVVNRDDDSYKRISNGVGYRTKGKLITFGMYKEADVNPKVFPFTTKLLGQFNEYNALAAITVCKVLGIDDEKIKKGIAHTPAPIGREEIVYEKDFTVMIDFAHTPNALKNILMTLKDKTQGKGRIIHVFGSAGQRDSSKRPAMGKTSAKFADVIILTSEDPRKESVNQINREIKSGMDRKREIFEIEDRQLAIEKAISVAKKYDYVLISGKGHEESMNLGKGETPWSDKEAVRKALGVGAKL